jgi:serine/threonine-protein kinase
MEGDGSGKLRPGDTFDRYVVEEALGQGGMGAVYRARDLKLQRLVALKIMAPRDPSGRPSGVTSDGAARLLREARAAAALNHPNVVSVYDVGEVDGAPFIAMEIVLGRSLRACMTDASQADKIRWLVDIAKALGAAHEHGLVHRDVKPENVMVRTDGVVKVLDFGIARRAQSAETPAADAAILPTLTGQGVVMGTPLYMAPEQIRGEDLDGRTDQFAWGVLAYELLSGKIPWGRTDDVMALVAAIVTREPERLDRIAPVVASAVADVVHRALAKGVADRFATMGDVAAAMLAASGTNASEIASPKSEPRTGGEKKIESVDRALVATEAAISDPALVATEAAPRTDPALVATEAALSVPRVEAAAPSPPPSKSRRVLLIGLAIAAIGGVIGALSLRSTGAKEKESATIASAADSANAPAGAVACKDAPIPQSKSADAVAAYRRGIQAWCDGNFGRMRLDFQKATELDPAMAAAHLRLGDIMFGEGDVEKARLELQLANQLRETLTPFERDMLAWDEALAMHESPDWNESLRVLDAALARAPGNAELWADRAQSEIGLNHYAQGSADAKRALEIDRHFGAAWYFLAQTSVSERRYEDAKHSVDECIKVSTGAAACLILRAQLRVAENECDGLEADARALGAAAPESHYSPRYLADVLALHGAEPEAVKSALAKWVQRTPNPSTARPLAEARLALWTGDFAAADAAGKAWQNALGDTADVKMRSDAVWQRISGLVESGKLADAGALANTFQAELDLSLRSGLNEGVFGDMTPRILEVARRSGAVTRAKWSQRRDDWIAAWKKTLPGKDDARAVELSAYVVPVETADDAKEALERLPALLPFTFELLPTADFTLGKAYFLADRTADAIPHLERAARSCVGLESPVDTVRALMMLGHARAKSGDRAGACAAYDGVVARWGAAKGRSVTLEETERERKKLGCGSADAGRSTK